jgi:hypothetical protein
MRKTENILGKGSGRLDESERSERERSRLIGQWHHKLRRYHPQWGAIVGENEYKR